METVNLVQKLQRELLTFERKTQKIELQTVYNCFENRTLKINLYSYIKCDFPPFSKLLSITEGVMDAGLHLPSPPSKLLSRQLGMLSADSSQLSALSKNDPLLKRAASPITRVMLPSQLASNGCLGGE